jgi:hypothetical protein
MNKYLVVKTDNNLIRDLDSNAIISKNNSEFDQFLELSKKKYKEKKEFENLKNDVESIRDEIKEIKNLLKYIANK